MIATPLNELGFEFFAFARTDHIKDQDLSFAYHVVLDNDSESPLFYGMCNDIPCNMCKFQPECEDGKHRSKVLTEYAVAHFPELAI